MIAKRNRTVAALAFLALILARTTGAATASFSQSQYVVGERDGSVTIEVTLSDPLSSRGTVSYGTYGVSAISGRDYLDVSGELVFLPGETRKTLTIPILSFPVLGNDEPERDETLTVRLSEPSPGIGVPSSGANATVIIRDALAVVYAVVEGWEPNPLQPDPGEATIDEAEGHASFVVRRDGDLALPFTVTFETVEGTAKPGKDFTATSGTLAFMAGETNKTVRVPILDNARVDGTRRFELRFGTISGDAKQAEGAGAGLTIVDNESPVGLLDPTFVPDRNAQGFVALQPDGKILTLSGRRLLRLKPDGSIDSSFQDAPAVATPLWWGGVERMPAAVEANGRILVVREEGVVRINADGSQDPSWPTVMLDGGVNAMAVQRGGGVLLVGKFIAVQGAARLNLARLKADGVLDASFPAGKGIGASSGIGIAAVALQDEGKILIGGDFPLIDGVFRPGLARLNPDGTVDASFLPQGRIPFPVGAIAVGRDGKILAAGGGTDAGAVHVVRLNLDGSPDSGFRPVSASGDFGYLEALVTALGLMPDGKILVGGSFSSIQGVAREALVRILPDGAVDTSFDLGRFAYDGSEYPPFRVTQIGVQPDGRAVIGGVFTGINGTPMPGVARLLEAPVAENAFETEPPGLAIFEGGEAAVTVLRRGDSTQPRTVGYSTIARTAEAGRDFAGESGALTFAPLEVRKTIRIPVRADGVIEPDETFEVALSDPGIGAGLGYHRAASIMVIDGDGRPGSLDASFDAGYIPPDDWWVDWPAVQVISVLADGRMYVAGHLQGVNGTPRRGIARLNPDGSVDPTFLPGVSIDGHQLVVQPDGKVLAGWNFFKRLNPDGSVDPTFKENIQGASSPEVLPFLQSNGRLIASGPGGITRFNTDGTIDSTFHVFAPEGPPWLDFAAGQPDGNILVAGETVLRLNADGNRDTAFKSPTLAGPAESTRIQAVGVQPDGRIVIAGNFLTVDGIGRPHIARLNPDGTLDHSFDAGSGLTYEPPASLRFRRNFRGGGERYAFAFQPDGRILLGGGFSAVNGVPRKGIARLLENGAVDPTFDPGVGVGGRTEEVWGIAAKPGGQIIVVGNFDSFGGVPRWGIARLNGDRNVVRLEAVRSEAGGPVKVAIASQAGRSYRIETSSDLVKWALVREVTATGSTVEFPVPEAVGGTAGFYRVLMQRAP